MKTLHIDIETYSDVDLKKYGVYRYADSPNFNILLFAYAHGDGPVQIVDLANGEVIPDAVLYDLEDPSVTKMAFNAQFERVCIDKMLKIDSGPWECTMIHAAYLGLASNLDTVGRAVGIAPDQQKLSTGKNLIRLFSVPRKPTKANEMKTVYTKQDKPEEWEQFKTYCVTDVEAERAIEKKLSALPMPEEEKEIYKLDQRINDRGVLIDMDLATAATDLDAQQTKLFEDRYNTITGLGSPNKLGALKTWIKDCTGESVSAITKDSLPLLTEKFRGHPAILEALEIRQRLSRSSVAKYKAMAGLACEDGRAKGLFRFYGASTGRWCLTGDHEVLTPAGWIRLDEWPGGKIACWNTLGETVSFQESSRVVFEYDGPMYHLVNKRHDQMSTPDHKMAYWTDEGWKSDTVEKLSKKRYSTPYVGYMSQQSKQTDNQLRVLVMTQADGHFTEDGQLRFHFKKGRKIDRCKKLLRDTEIPFTVREYEDRTVITIPKRSLPLWVSMFENKELDWWMLKESADVIFDELVYWDGYRCGPNSIQYSSTNEKNVDVLQALAILTGRSATKLIKKVRNENWSPCFVLNVWLNPSNRNEVRKKPSLEQYKGKVFCAETKTGFFMVRRNGKVWVTGNSGRGIQPQNLPRNYLNDLDSAREVIRQKDLGLMEMLYDDPADVLSQCIRTAIIPAPGKKFLVADFSAIEARVIAWLAGESWRMDVFRSHGKIYEASAAQMFKVPVESIGKGSDLRQKGKVAELALGYQGSVGALRQMGALDMGIYENELPVLVERWRAANPAIVRFWGDVEVAARQCIKTRQKMELQGLVFSYRSGILFIRLPSGRELAYPKAQVRPHSKFDYGEEIAYMELKNGDWASVSTYGGKLTENIVQAIARDCLAVSMLRVEAAGYPIVMHVHDEIVIESDAQTADADLVAVCDLMGEVIAWAPDLPLRADGFVCDYYQKD